MADACILSIVVSKLGYWKEPSPLILLVIDKNSEIGLYYTVWPLGLAISLRVKSNRAPLLDSKEVVW